MQLLSEVVNESWFSYLNPDHQQLVKLTMELYQREVNQPRKFVDYAFITFPIVKAYEGFLKKYLLDLHLIPDHVYRGHKFRIGRALNPSLRDIYRDEQWLFDDVSQQCGPAVAQQLWETWLACRNKVFHYFVDEPAFVPFERAEKNIEMVIDAMNQAVTCMKMV